MRWSNGVRGGVDTMSTQEQLHSTDHFWYRLQPIGPYLDSHRGNRAFGRGDDAVFLSEDCGRTWPHRTEFPAARNITFSCILRNGNVLFATGSELYLGTDNLKTCERITVKAPDGSDYLPHAPQNLWVLRQ